MGAVAAGKSGGRKGRSRQEDGEIACRSCGAGNRSGARFCQDCGRSLTKGDGRWFDMQSLTVIGAACLTLLALGLLFSSVIEFGTTADEEAAAPAPTRTASSADGQPPDLSTMTPREAADRLFNRVMMADEQGDAGEVAQFAPMAVAAYDQLGSLDLDALYHVGLIHAAAGDAALARDAVERLRTVVPGHLLASQLDHRLAIDAKDTAAAERAIERFNASYDEEIAIDRPEYEHHRRLIEQFRSDVAGTGGG